MQTIAIGCDHGGFALKGEIIRHLAEKGIECRDFGCMDTNSVDYPDIALPLAKAVREDENLLGVLICGTGIGVSLAANKVPGIREAVCGDPYSARMAREHNNAQIVCLGARVIGPSLACEIVDAFLGGEFAGGRHQNRVDKITAIEQSYHQGV